MSEISEERNGREMVTLRDFVKAKLQALEKANVLFQRVLDARLAGMNEFREDLRRQANTFITRDEFLAMHERVKEDIRSLRESRAQLQGKASHQSVMVAIALALIGNMIGAIAIVVAVFKR